MLMRHLTEVGEQSFIDSVDVALAHLAPPPAASQASPAGQPSTAVSYNTADTQLAAPTVSSSTRATRRRASKRAAKQRPMDGVVDAPAFSDDLPPAAAASATAPPAVFATVVADATTTRPGALLAEAAVGPQGFALPAGGGGTYGAMPYAEVAHLALQQRQLQLELVRGSQRRSSRSSPWGSGS